MKPLVGCVSMALLLLAAGCSDAGLLEVDTAQDLFSDGSSDRWIVGDTLAAAAVMKGEARVLFMGQGTFSPFIVDCVDPENFADSRGEVTGRFFFLDDFQGSIVLTRCTVDDEGGEAFNGSWSFISEKGKDEIRGTFSMTMEGRIVELTHRIRGGTGRFADAKGWFRSHGTIDEETGTGRFYSKGVISPPLDIEHLDFYAEFSVIPDTAAGGFPCVDRQSELVPEAFRAVRSEVVGVAMHLGRTTGSFNTDLCGVNADGSVASRGEFVFMNARGDAIRGSYIRVPQGDREVTEHLVRGGEGRFAGAEGTLQSNWMLDPETGAGTLTVEGTITRLRGR